jgi:hypothetical protein
MADIQHQAIPEPYIHEPKGAAGATAGQSLVSTGAGATEFRELVVADVSDLQAALDLAAEGDAIYADGVGGYTVEPIRPRPGQVSQGIYDYNDLATATTPIPLTVPGTQYVMTNDALGPYTLLDYALPGLTTVWDATTNTFNWVSGGDVLALGDTVDIRFDLEVTTTAVNTAISGVLEIGQDGTPEQLPILPSSNFKVAGTYNLIRWFGIYMGGDSTLNFPAQVLLSADTAGATVKVNGWYVRVQHTNT